MLHRRCEVHPIPKNEASKSPEIETPESQEKTDSEKSNSGKKILVAEDDQASAVFLKIALEKKGFQVLFAGTGTEALEVMEANPDLALIFMDIKMPEMDGYEASKKARKINNSIPIVAQTSFALTSEKDRFSHAFDDYITKPLTTSKIDDVIRKLI